MLVEMLPGGEPEVAEKIVEDILVLFDRAVSDNHSFVTLRNALEKSPRLGQYMRLLAADQGRVDAEAAAALSISVVDLKALQQEALTTLRTALGPGA